MAFDFDIAISRLSLGGGDYDNGTSMQNLAARYPELDFLFHKLEEQAAMLEDMVPRSDLKTMEEQRDHAEGVGTELTIRLQQISQLVGLMLRMDAAKPLAIELSGLAKQVSDAVLYGERAA